MNERINELITQVEDASAVYVALVKLRHNTKPEQYTLTVDLRHNLPKPVKAILQQALESFVQESLHNCLSEALVKAGDDLESLSQQLTDEIIEYRSQQ